MARLADLPEWEQKHLFDKIPELKDFHSDAWVTGPVLSKRRVALITTSGIHRASDPPFSFGDASSDYRVISADVEGGELVMSHLSVNFDRTGFQQDINVVFPIDRLRELAADKIIGSVADFHYAFMGAARIKDLEPYAREVAGLLKRDQVDAVLLTPV